LIAVLVQCSPSVLRRQAVPNDNRVAGGTLRDGVLTVALEAREAIWSPDGPDAPSLVLEMFGEVGKPTQNPGPLIRVAAGTTIDVTITNTLDSTLVVYGFDTRPSTLTDTLQITAGATRTKRFVAGAPGTYFYWATTTHRPIDTRNRRDGQLHGALVIDSAGAPAPNDRIFVLGSYTGPIDSASGFAPDLRTINGLSWPRTERLSYTAGDTVRWRWVNPTDSPHPMHLHGFYFDVTHRGTWAADTAFAVANAPSVVTEMPLPGGTYEMRWVPNEPGNWLMHCHVAYHTSMFLAATIPPDPKDPVVVDPVHGTRGMVMAINVKPGASTQRRAEGVAGARRIRLVAKAAPRRFQGSLDEMAFVADDDPLSNTDSVPAPSSLLVLKRNEPVRVTIVNRTRATTGVHWHGIEVPAYSDGVPGFSGSGNRLAPMITPGDSFVAEFTPPRSGTFMYHAHSNEGFQIGLGLYGGLLVVDSGAYDPARERLIILGGTGPGERGARINGRAAPDTLRLTAGESYRLRIVHIVPDWTARVTLRRGEGTEEWRALAKDGAELPSHLKTTRAATFIAGPGETMDFEYRPSAPGLLSLDVGQRTGEWKTALPIRVEPGGR
jgi:FtsP/CotA-like multicopper oxidase with cupredoxin domain